MGRQAFGTHGISGNVLANPVASSSAPCPKELTSWSSHFSEQIHSSQWKRVRVEHNIKIRDASLDRKPKFQSSSVEETIQRIWSRRTTTADFGSSFRQIHHTSNIRLLEIRFKTEVCTCSQFLTEAMQWIKEVEMVESVDELRSSSSTRGISMPNFDVLDARIASALQRIIHNSHFKRRICLEEQ